MALNSTADPSPGSQIALRPDILNDRKSLFHCFYASSDTAIQQIQNSIKDPVDLQQILTYAVAYIDQGVSVSNDERKQYEILVKRYGAAEEKIKKDQGKLQVLNEKLKTQDARIIELEIKLAAHERVYPKIRPVSSTEAQQGQVSLTPVEAQLVNARQQLAEKTSLLEENHEKYEHMLVVEKQAKDIAEREKVALEARVVALTQEVLTLQKSLAQVHGQLEEAKHHLDVDGHIISGVQEERDNLKTLFNKKMVEVKSLGDELQLVRTELKTATEEHLLFEGKHKDCQKRLEEVVRQYEALKEEKRVLEEEHKTCQAAQPKPSADEEPPEDLSKPVQPNKVTLKNPIKIAGSLRGARKEIDDKFWEVNVPFPITIFGYKSSKIFVSDNGTICLDQATHATDKREGERLPHYDRMPVYSLFPYWTDLLIAKDMPHGIFWEVTGASPNRSLSIEWYVTRYRHEEQYFHFKVVVDEASPNVVAFEYYDVRDKGAKGTIGVQGPKNAHLQFSYNKAKLYPGLRLVFDTAKNNITESRCEVPQ